MDRTPFSLACALAGLACPAALQAEAAGSLATTQSAQVVQNKRADADDLSRIKDLPMLRRFVRAGLLVGVPAKTSHYYLHGIPAAYRYVRPWSKLFLDRLSRQFHARFHKQLRVTSLVRTVGLQNSIARHNDNAAAAWGSRRSSHLRRAATCTPSRSSSSPPSTSWFTGTTRATLPR